MTSTLILSSSAHSARRKANSSALSWSPESLGTPTMILEGWRLSYSALPSLRNSGEKMTLWILFSLQNLSVNPIGMVDLMTMIASGHTDCSCLMTDSTEPVLK